MATFSFGSNPATTTTGSSFAFGSNTMFPSFGAATTQPSAGAFGAATTQPSAGAFGAPAAGGLGATTPQRPGGFTFGGAATSTPSTTGLSFGGGGLNFKAPTTTATPGGFTFGANAQQPTPNLGMPSATTSAPTAGLSLFGTPTATLGAPPAVPSAQPTLSFGMPGQTGTTIAGTGLLPTPATTQPNLSFAPPASSTAAKPLSTFTFGAPTTTNVAVTNPVSTTGLSFGFSTPAKTTVTTGFSLTAPSSTGIFGFPSTTTAITGIAPATTANTASPVFKGLGGVDTSLTSIGGGVSGAGSGGRQENKTAKENQVPTDILQSIENFKVFVKNQKTLSCEVARASVKPMAKVTEDTQALQQLLSSLLANIEKNNSLAERLKAETSKGFAQCEMAQRTQDTPAGLQNDNSAPLEFFMNLVTKFEHVVQVLRQEIDNTEKHVHTLSQPSALAPQELSMALKRLHESFVALSGRLQVVHRAVIALKERHLSLRRHFLKDTNDIFGKASSDPNKKNVNVAGPTPFSALGTVQTLGMMASQDKTISSFSGGNSSVPGWGTTQTATPAPSVGTGSSYFAGSSPFSSTVDNSNFQLLKPPPGNKRGKR